jgi:phosphoribosyl-AMP cyclohydrolase
LWRRCALAAGRARRNSPLTVLALNGYYECLLLRQFLARDVLMDNLLTTLNFKDGLIPAVITDAATGQVLTLCYMSREAVQRTLETGFVHVFRRSKGRLMKKGETSGHVQRVREVRIDCEANSLLICVEQHVAACHKGYFTCYFRRYNSRTDSFETVGERVFDPDSACGGGAG